MPDWKPEIRRRMAGLQLSPTREAAIVEELAQHLDDCYAESLSGGATEAEARRAALAELHGSELLARELRFVERQANPEPIILGSNRRTNMIADLWQDLRFGARMLRKQPGFTLIAVITLALGIGANTAIFSVVNVLIFKPLPYPDSQRLVSLARENPAHLAGAASRAMQFWSYPIFTALREQSLSYESIAAYQPLTTTVTVDEQPERQQGEIVSVDYFALLGVKAALGRTFSPEEGRVPDTHAVVLLSHNFWQQRFGGNREVVGKTLYLKQLPFTVIGVLPAGFRGETGAAEFWAPDMMAGKLLWNSVLSQPGSQTFKIIARLKPSLELEQAQAELTLLTEQITHELPSSRLAKSGAEVSRLIPLKETKVDPAVKRAFLILLGAVICLLLITCANTASLMLARAVARQHEFAVRLALGASSWRIVRQSLTESVLIALLGGIAGILFAFCGVAWLTTAKPWNTVGFWSQYAQTFDYFTIKLDSSALAFNFLLALLTGIVFGLAPAYQSTRLQVGEMLKTGRNNSAISFRLLRRFSLRGILVVAEIALSLVLLVSAGLLIKSFNRLMAVKLGFSPEGVVKMDVGSSAQPDFQRLLLERVRALPGVQSASFSDSTPLETTNKLRLEIEGVSEETTKEIPVGVNVITPDYFRTYRIPVLKGRSFTEQDHSGAPRVAVINRLLAERFWPDQEPLGKRFKSPLRADDENADPWIEIVGVVDDVRHNVLEEPAEPLFYLSAWQPTLTPNSLSIQTNADLTSIVAAVRREVQWLDKTTPLYRITTLNERAAQITSRYRYSALLMGIFAGLALALAGVGIFGVMAYTVSARTHEIGIRMALGALQRDALKLVLRQALGLILPGIALGLLATFLLTRLITSLLYGVTTTDPLTYVAVASLLILVALLACWIPARRATKVDPLIALRHE